jgi:hypothetical protein
MYQKFDKMMEVGIESHKKLHDWKVSSNLFFKDLVSLQSKIFPILYFGKGNFGGNFAKKVFKFFNKIY